MQQVIRRDIPGQNVNASSTSMPDPGWGQHTSLSPAWVEELEALLGVESAVDDPAYALALHQGLKRVAQALRQDDGRNNKRFLGEFPRYGGTAHKLLEARHGFGSVLGALAQRVLETGSPLTARELVHTRRLLRTVKSNLATEKELYWHGYWVDLGAGD